MAGTSFKPWRDDAPKDRLADVRKLRQRVHESCHEIEYIGVEVATTIVFLFWLIRTVWHELGR
jgi:hypothetical protein